MGEILIQRDRKKQVSVSNELDFKDPFINYVPRIVQK